MKLKIRFVRLSVAAALLSALIQLPLAASDEKALPPITLASLLDEMLDRDAVTRFPEPCYKMRLWSSASRASVAPEKPGWFDNHDWSNYLRDETNAAGVVEHVMVDAKGPGALVRAWITGCGHDVAEKLRFYVDGSSTPLFEGTGAELMGGEAICGAPLSARLPKEDPAEGFGRNLFLPIPFAKGLKVTVVTSEKQKYFYYNFETRQWPAGTAVESLTKEVLAASKDKISAANAALANANEPVPSGETLTFDATLAPGERKTVSFAGVGAIRYLQMSSLAPRDIAVYMCQREDPQIRDVEIELSFDGETTVKMPIGEFFNAGLWGYDPQETRFTGVSGKTMACRWVMPFEKSFTMTLVNTGDSPVALSKTKIVRGSYAWDARSMRFGATYVPRTDLPTRRKGLPYDITYDNLKGRGVLVGASCTIENAARRWWGEGDEKIWVDGEKAPSFFGTGTEDFYGYAWCNGIPYTHPFGAQPRGDCNGVQTYFGGYAVNFRARVLDAIPFRESVRFDMELWHWADARIRYDSVSWHYLVPKADAPLKDVLAEKMLPAGSEFSTWDAALRELKARDVAADAAWRALADRAAYDARRKDLHAKMLAAIGTFPERTPLNAKILGTVRKDDYRVEKILFESMPGLFVTGNLFIPNGIAGRVPVVVMSCGHATVEGKDSDAYLRACVHVVRRGMVAFMFDPYEQGERRQYSGSPRTGGSCDQHNLIGVKAMLLGWSMPMLRLWDGIRAVDYVATRPECDPDRIGYMGQSGGGTMTALMTAADWRLKATAPSCYLTSLRELCASIGPQDAEQNIFGQLAFGLNHTGYVLLPDTKVCVTGRYGDMFPWVGVQQLWVTVQATSARVGTAGNYALNFAPGPHGWTESTEAASAAWMAAWLKGEKNLLPLDMPKYLAMNTDFDMAKAEHGLEGTERGVLGGRRTTALPGARDIHAILRDRLATLTRSSGRAATKDKTALSALVKKSAGIRDPKDANVTVRVSGSVTSGAVTATRLVFSYPDGRVLPAVLVEGAAAAGRPPYQGKAPVLLVATEGRGACAARAAEIVRAGGRALVADVSGAGEIRKGRQTFYKGEDVPEEGTAVMLYLLGESLVGWQATDLLVLADYLKTRHGAAPRLEAKGSVAIAAAHAAAAEPSAFAGVTIADAPPSWTAFVEKPGEPMVYRYAWSVNGALADYDWTDLLK